MWHLTVATSLAWLAEECYETSMTAAVTITTTNSTYHNNNVKKLCGINVKITSAIK
jgi:hypothetical protein